MVIDDDDDVAWSGNGFEKDEMTGVIWVVSSVAEIEEFSVCDLVSSGKVGYWCKDWLQIERVGGNRNDGEEIVWSWILPKRSCRQFGISGDQNFSARWVETLGVAWGWGRRFNFLSLFVFNCFVCKYIK